MNGLKLILLINYLNLIVIYGWVFESGFDNLDKQWINNGLLFKNSGFICNIEVWDGSQDEFLSRFAYKAPVVLKSGVTNNKQFRDRHSIAKLVERFGDSIVRLSSANSFSYDKIDVPFKTYVNDMLNDNSLDKLGNETFYFFGDALPHEMNQILKDYNPPPFQLPDMKPALSFGIAGGGTGVPFHFHGPGFSETISGSKHWFLYPPDKTPSFHPNETTLQWFLNNEITNDENLLQCTIHEGQAIYFPNHWWHSTLNLETSVFMSTFLGPI